MKSERSGRQALKGGAYSLAVTAVVLAIVISVNDFASVLPASLTKLDISSGKLYSVYCLTFICKFAYNRSFSDKSEFYFALFRPYL